MFKKPTRSLRQRRVTDESDHEEDEDNTADNTSKTASADSTQIPKAGDAAKKFSVPVAAATKSVAQLLSFEEDTETAFQVKKSKASKRFAKTSERDKHKQSTTTVEEHVPVVTVPHNVKITTVSNKSKQNQNSDSNTNTRRTVVDDDARIAERHVDTQREETEAQLIEDELRRLNAEADGPTSSNGKLRGGQIPDASFINFARRQRQVARDKETDDGQVSYTNSTTGTTVEHEEADRGSGTGVTKFDRKFDYAEEEHAARDDDDEEEANIERGGLLMRLDAAELERKRLREDFLAAEQGSSESQSESDMDRDRDRDSNPDRRSRRSKRQTKIKRTVVEDEEACDWEMQQIRKAVGRSRYAAQPSGGSLGQIGSGASAVGQYATDYGQIARMWIAAGQHNTTDSLSGAANTKQVNDVERRAQPSLAELRSSFLRRLEDAEGESAALRKDRENCADEMERCSTLLANLDRQLDDLDREYQFYQLHREFVEAVLNCADTKVVAIREREDALFAAFRARTERLTRRRADDLNDQSNDLMAALLTARGGAPQAQPASSGTSPKELMDTELRLRRVAEREARRARRRKRREASGISGHHEGMSTDDEELPSDMQKFNADKEAALRGCDSILEDVDEEYQLTCILRRHADWATQYSSSFQDCFMADFVPKLIEPYARLELVSFWFDFDACDARNLDEIRRILATQRWFVEVSKLATMSRERSGSNAVNCFEKLLSECIEQIFIVGLQHFVEACFDPLSITHTRKLSLVLECCIDHFGCNPNSKTFESFFDALFTRFRKSVDEVFIPVLVNKNLAADERLRVHYAFLQRQFWSAAKLFANILSMARFVDASRTQSLIIDIVLNRYVMMAFQLLDVTTSGDLLERLEFIIGRLPRNWLDTTSPNALSDTQRQPLIKFLSGLFEAYKADKSTQKQFIKMLLKLEAEAPAVAMCTKYGL